MIILDTCALLWLAAGSDRLTVDARKRIDAETIVAVSAISAFEIALKYRDGKLELPLPPRDWWSRVIDHHRVDVSPSGTGNTFHGGEFATNTQRPCGPVYHCHSFHTQSTGGDDRRALCGLRHQYDLLAEPPRLLEKRYEAIWCCLILPNSAPFSSISASSS